MHARRHDSIDAQTIAACSSEPVSPPEMQSPIAPWAACLSARVHAHRAEMRTRIELGCVRSGRRRRSCGVRRTDAQWVGSLGRVGPGTCRQRPGVRSITSEFGLPPSILVDSAARGTVLVHWCTRGQTQSMRSQIAPAQPDAFHRTLTRAAADECMHACKDGGSARRPTIAGSDRVGASSAR